MTSNIDRLFDILNNLNVFEGLGTIDRTREAAEELDRAGVVAAGEYRYGAFTEMHDSIDSDTPLPIVEATHRQRKEGDWEPLPDGEHRYADTLIIEARP